MCVCVCVCGGAVVCVWRHVLGGGAVVCVCVCQATRDSAVQTVMVLSDMEACVGRAGLFVLGGWAVVCVCVRACMHACVSVLLI